MTTTGIVFDISRGCVDDGPGLRTVVFLKGCSLGCPWCHNPEGIARAPEIALDQNRCIRCGQCAQTCSRSWSPNRPDEWRDGCVACGDCVRTCPSGARRLVGSQMSAATLAEVLLEDLDFFIGTGGGVTFSGGEPLLQSEFLFACARRLRSAGVHVAVETAGLWPRRLVPELVDAVDLVLFDLKHADTDRLRDVMGHDCRLLLQNLTALLATDVAIEVRITMVPGFNDSDEDLEALAGWLGKQTRVPPVRLQCFHTMATAKAGHFASEYSFAATRPLRPDAIAAATNILESQLVPVASD